MEKRKGKRATAWIILMLISAAEFVGLPCLLAIGFGVGGLPTEAQHLSNPTFYIWWQAVQLGLVIWIPIAGGCFWMIWRNRDTGNS